MRGSSPGATLPPFAQRGKRIAFSAEGAYAGGMFPPALRLPAVAILLISRAGAQSPAKYSLHDAGQQRSFDAVAEAGSVVLYESGRERSLHARRDVTGEVLVRMARTEDAAGLALMSGALSWQLAPVLDDAVIFTFPGPPATVLATVASLRRTTGVRSAEPILARLQTKRWTPNDPYFANNAANAGYQWHLKNTGARGGVAGVDINLATVWDHWRGAGIRIALLDDGLQTNHPDLAANTDTVNDYDWNSGDNDPSPGVLDYHGTACAGVAGGIGNNGTGICGVAPEATLVGLRLVSSASTDTTESAAFLHHNDIIQVKNNSWGPDDTGNVVEGPGPLASAALQQAATTGRGGLGTIITWAAGNGLAFGDDANYDGYANSLYTIAVTALGDGGTQPSYAEPGANILIAAPSAGGAQKISTTDLTGSSGYNAGGGGNYASADYTNTFDGTSAAAPVASGGIALLLQSRPGLGWRDVKEILLRSATKNHPADAGWFNNGAGFHFNDKYGAGQLNVQAAVTLAAAWSNLGPLLSSSAGSPGALAIPDNSSTGVAKTFTISSGQNLRVEQIAVAVSVTHQRRGQLNYTLTSPSGTICRLARPRPDNNADLAWTFTSPQFWGEPATGLWTLRVSDTVANRTGTLNSATLTLYGAALDADGDGFTADVEAWFGTSDSDAASTPTPVISRPGGTGTVTFPSVAGNAYALDASTDLTAWTTVTVTAAATSTTWTDPAGPLPKRRYYRVRKI